MQLTPLYLNTILYPSTPAPIRGYFGLIPPYGSESLLQYQPIIFDNFLSLQSYGIIYKLNNEAYNDDSSVPLNRNYLPIYLNIEETSQIFVSE